MIAADPAQGTDAELLHLLQSGSNDTWSTVILEYSPRLYSYLRRNVPTELDAEDLLSETFVAAVHAVHNFDGRVAFSTLLYSIAYRKVADFWRRSAPTVSLDSEEEHGALARLDPDLLERLEFESVLAALPEVSRQALLLRYHVGLGVGEIAAILQRTYKGTESVLSRARAQLRDELVRNGKDVAELG